MIPRPPRDKALSQSTSRTSASRGAIGSQVVRVAGLSSSQLPVWNHGEVVALLDEDRRLATLLSARREEAVERLFEIIASWAPDDRRTLLTWKRHCFNQRSIRKYRSDPLWAVANSATGEILTEVARLEDEVEALEIRLGDLYGSVAQQEEEAIFACAEEPAFARGLALSSPSVVDGLRRHAKRGLAPRKTTKLRQSLARYLTRAGMKLSPYSTFTVLALARSDAISDPRSAVRIVSGERTERSMVRVKRYLLDQVCALLFLRPETWRRLSLGLNPSLEALSSDHYRFVRLARLAADSSGQDLDRVPASQVKIRIGGDLVPTLCRLLESGLLPFGRLARELADTLGDTESSADDAVSLTESWLVQLVNAGVLEVKAPWNSFEPRLEDAMLRYLEQQPEAERWADSAAVNHLRRLIELEKSFATSSAPLDSVRAIDRSIITLYECIEQRVNRGQHRPLKRAPEASYYEDVFWAPADRRTGGLVELERTRMERVHHVCDVVYQLGSVFSPHHDMLHSVHHALTRKLSDEASISFLGAFAEVRDTWAAYCSSSDRPTGKPFDPFNAPSVRDLEACRTALRGELAAAEQLDDVEQRFELEQLSAILREVPAELLPSISTCAFVQPGDAAGDTWVVNGMFAGTGRMTARYNILMEPPGEAPYVTERIAHSHFADRHGVPTELVDVLFTKGNTVNVHWPQTRRLVITPGETCFLPSEKLLYLRDLQLRWTRDGGMQLVDSDGQRILPCFLSPLQEGFAPSVIRFLCLFGVHSAPMPFLRTQHATSHEGEEYRRVSVGSVIFGRRTWVARAEATPSGKPGAATWLAVNRWRRRWGLPRQVYFQTSSEASRAQSKPQYLDFASPSLCELFMASTHRCSPTTRVRLVEALPRPDDFPEDPDGGRRGIEVMLEALPGHWESP